MTKIKDKSNKDECLGSKPALENEEDNLQKLRI